MASKKLQSIDQLQARYESLMAEKVKFETQRDSAANELTALKKEAVEKFGSDDVAELEKMLAAMLADNEKRAREYQSALDKIDLGLQSVQESLHATEPTD